MKQVNKRELAVNIFSSHINTHTSQGGSLSDREFRRKVLRALDAAFLGLDPNAGDIPSNLNAMSAAYYNYAKKACVAAGVIPNFSRSAKLEGATIPQVEVAPVVITEVEAIIEPAPVPTTLQWAIVDKATGEVVGYGESRRKAQAQKTETQTVKKVEELA